MKLLQTVFCIFLISSLNACQPTQSATSKVDANDFASFWIWGDIQTAPYLVHAQELYILQGEIRYSKSKQISTFTPQGVSILKLPHQKIWLVLRTHHLAWNEQNYQTILNRLEHWRNQGNQVQGIQIDFDSKTNSLKDYAIFLQKLRQKLPQQYRLSITGLLDWTNFKDQNTLTLFRQNIDELVIQTYQGTTTIPNYPEYLKRISALRLPYKVGLVQHGTWFGNSTKQKDPYFKGYVVFLLRSKA
ncbi:MULTISPECIES: DUF3142 domain-containing protein [unclassified Acinetobacter]|uniref:DUF3142 domain-containing protein n=1 Tax=unclassified Acinetobacter TaxID=196816 RepID=UPI00244BCA45|nr:MULTISPECIES: DUF3142 domain-containing protein [unclassified Acinetobacter]MDH0031793.1 DUF3142 domain-containing protein [Acinetobacter sp. GD04021]MDH0886108.1 DUF3142 domain-containing protein [Acinetobacter sp. GD03873]MDH1082728.1 DUF3142 domain-containing protein [Acinetobacter sp. GD03983]MDH2189477.1 DUF3142 domain-containing protein [Acinetobacter sp. GD03645]MDH2204817.1 DUF3142 domain-containing protein [Acinetobacter sp. GD03647]